MTSGLEGIKVVETRISEVDGAHGRLIVRGYPIEELTGAIPFERMVALLWEAEPHLGEGRVRAWEQLQGLLQALPPLPVCATVRLGLSALQGDRDTIVGAVAVLVAAACRRGRPLIAPDASRSHAADLLRMMHGETAAAEALDAYLVTVAEHGMNASTFAARIIASTGAGLAGASVGALAALEGPLHGGAPGPVLDMLDAIGDPSRAAAWIEQALRDGHRLMGFGHRIYRVRDPRADVLRAALGRLKQNQPSARLALADAVEAAALEALARHKPGRPLQTNVEFATALLLEALAIPRDAFTGIFACARVAGWIAHAQEQAASGRLMRPDAEYVGPRTAPAGRP
ncbi:MAG: citrate synthase [Candidatus Xenobia bacterium]